MKVLLFDANVDGHHADYASHLARHLLESGDSVTFASTADLTHSDRLRALSPPLQLETLSIGISSPRLGRAGRVAESRELIRQCSRLAESQRADVVHHLFLDGAELAWLTAPSQSNRTWVTFASRFTMEYSVRGSRTGLREAAISLAKRGALRNVIGRRRLDGIFVHSPRAESALRGLLGPRALAETVTFVADPAPPVNDVPQRDARTRLDLPAGGPILLFFGGLRRDKGPDLFLRALALVSGEWTAVIAGEPLSVSADEVHELARALPSPSSVILRLGVIPDTAVDDYFAAADVVVLPYRESYGGIGASSGVLMRATSAARPVIVTDVGDVGPIVRKNQLGVVVTPESIDALAAGITSCVSQWEELSRDVSPRALAYARENSWQVMGETVRNTYLARLQQLRGTGGKNLP